MKVEKIKYSEKGREVKIYAPVRKLIVLVPEKTDRKSVADLIRRYLGVILAASLASGLIELFTRNQMKETMAFAVRTESISAPMILSNETSDINGTAMISEGQKSIIDYIITHPGIIFLLGCLFVIVLFIILDYRKNNRTK